MRLPYPLIFIALLFVSCKQYVNDESETETSNIRQYTIADKDLFTQIKAMDKAFFDAYNRCDLEKQAFVYSDDIEFFHDQGGFMTSKEEIIAGTKKFICDKVSRTIVEGSMEVYPIKDYGAVEIGYHTFYNNQEPDAPSHPSKFIIMWKKELQEWKITKVISLH